MFRLQMGRMWYNNFVSKKGLTGGCRMSYQNVLFEGLSEFLTSALSQKSYRSSSSRCNCPCNIGNLSRY